MQDTDVYVYIGDVHRSGHHDITKAIKERKTNHGLQKNVLFASLPMAVIPAQDIELAALCNTTMSTSPF